MDQIYAGAYATIIACTGSDANHGLPGVSRPRATQHWIEAPNLELCSHLRPLPDEINHTVWNSRGWTYQEATLLRRCLYFTKSHVHLACLKWKCSEVETSTEDVRRLTADPNQKRKLWTTHGDENAFEILVSHIRNFNKRHLTYEGDRLDAFRGLLVRQPFRTYYGIPIVSNGQPWLPKDVEDFNQGFIRGLSWGFDFFSSAPKISRRPGFPSWSWLGWTGHIMYPHIYPGFRMQLQTHHPKFWIQGRNGELQTLKTMADAVEKTAVITELSPYLLVETEVYTLSFRSYKILNDNGYTRTELRAKVTSLVPGWSRLGVLVTFFETNLWTSRLEGGFEQDNWDCFHSYTLGEMERVFRLIRWEDNTAHVIGICRLWPSDWSHAFAWDVKWGERRTFVLA